ncbi:TetR/AcrR family transcriptional regulator [Agromyces protaetiae]|uniref:TetR/AcrR family transcriptional regulator n=1 Tax=Agromyces protaetiae TaxID=2509455 RepID=A0A4P6F9Q1_9MICO|nr:TetR/AcrR family transcriptional regulator [Agromyces protaetiae]
MDQLSREGGAVETEVIWNRERDIRKGPRPTHTLDEIARAAVALGDANGIEGVSIRAIASELGAGAASLYRYISRKDDLFDLMVDQVIAELELPASPSGSGGRMSRLSPSASATSTAGTPGAPNSRRTRPGAPTRRTTWSSSSPRSNPPASTRANGSNSSDC